MRLFRCQKCQNLLYFENVACNQCGAVLGFLPETLTLHALEPAGNGLWETVGDRQLVKLCKNYQVFSVCNWILPAESPEDFCLSCRFNEVIPDLRVAGNQQRWQTLENAKRRLLYSLLRLKLPLTPRSIDPSGLGFAFLADEDPAHSQAPAEKVLTGHANGLITLNIAEADSSERERVREEMGEPYRTILGHFRHESGHYYWDRLIHQTDKMEAFRAVFGDERLDYSEALKRHYQQGPPSNWHESYISSYATTHPWEDWAESWAHFLHLIDTLETAYHFGLRLRPTGEPSEVSHDFDAYAEPDFQRLIEHWLPLTVALNSLNRSMGLGHAYPFVLSQPIIDKLHFIHQLVHPFHKAGTT
ncbi:MAG: putative zinc-binding metallopeptidase [Puniceicoccaceae bacterium]